jgi:anti-sigma factor RsiW
MPTCRDVTELATDYQEGTLSLRRRLEVRLHLLMCRFCRRYLAQMRTVADALRRLPPERPPEAVRERLVAAFREAPRSAHKPKVGGSERS